MSKEPRNSPDMEAGKYKIQKALSLNPPEYRSLLYFISPPNSYMHRQGEVPGRNSGFTARKIEIHLKCEPASIYGIKKGV